MRTGPGALGTLLLGAVLLAAAGCGEEKLRPEPPAAEPAARLVVSEGFGARLVREARVAPGQSVMSALRGVADVRTSYGGSFVQAVDGTEGSAAEARDWFYFVNGVAADRGAAEYILRDGDETWWDYRPWRRYQSVPVVVGSWPEPFVHGFRGPRPEVSADPPLDRPLRHAGARVVTASTPWRVRVGADAELRRADPAWRRAVRDTRGHGLTTWIADGAVYVWSTAGQAEVIPEATAVVAAVQVGDRAGDGALLVVSGLDDAAARNAAAALVAAPELLGRRFAVALDATGRVVAAGGVGRV